VDDQRKTRGNCWCYKWGVFKGLPDKSRTSTHFDGQAEQRVDGVELRGCRANILGAMAWPTIIHLRT